MAKIQTIAIFGAGSGLGQSLAGRFGREGYHVALVARRAASLAKHVAELEAQGIEAAAFPSDLEDIDGLPQLVTRIKERMGTLDVAVYAPVSADAIFVPAAQLDAARMRKMANIFAVAPIEIARNVIPDMLARGDGAYLVVSGLSAVMPMPGMSGPGPAMAAARNHALTLYGEVMPQGIYAGSVSIGGGIERSEGFTSLLASGIQLNPDFPILNPDDIAQEIWGLVTRRDKPEAIIPPFPDL